MEGEQRTEIPDGLGYGTNEEAEVQIDESGLDELDSLAGELDEESPADDFERDLGWDSDEEDEEETDEGVDEDAGEGEEVDESEDEDIDEDDSDVDADDEPDEGEGEDTDEDEPLYDKKRDFPDDDFVPPSTYKDRVALNSGVAAKINHGRDLVEKLEAMDRGVGAIDLPEMFEGNEEFVKNPFNREEFADMDDETAKKAVYELDKFIKSVNNKIDRVEPEHNLQEQKAEVTEEYQSAVDDLVKSLDLVGVSQQEATNMAPNQVLSRAEQAIQDFKENQFDEIYTEKGVDEANARLRELEQAKDSIKAFPEVAKKYKEVSEKDAPESNVPDPEQVTSAYKEWQEDQSNLPIFKANTDAQERDFLEFVNLKVSNKEVQTPGTAREWHQLYKQHQKVRQEEYEKYKSKSKSSSSKKNASDNKGKNKKKPSASKVKNTQNISKNELTTEDVDDTLDDLANELDATFQ